MRSICVAAPLLPKLFQFALPLIRSGVLRLLLNVEDIIVVGRFAGKDAFALSGLMPFLPDY